jgi:hypothetical protein
MKGFVYSYDLTGRTPLIRKYPIADSLAIEKGEPVSFTQGTGIIVHAGPTDFKTPVLGVSMNEKAANDGQTELEVSVSPTAVYKYSARGLAYTATGGSTTTFVDSSLLGASVNDFYKGGMIEIVSCAANSALNGKRVKISASTVASGTLTLAETLPSALAAGDTAYICLGEYAHNHLGFDLTSTAMNIDLDADGGKVLRIVDTNPETMEMFVMFENKLNVS